MKESSIFDHSGCLTASGLLLYSGGKLSLQNREKAEKHIATCELCSDAAQGLHGMSPGELNSAVHEIDSRIDTLVDSKVGRTNLRWLAAACLVLLIGGVSVLVFNVEKDQSANVLSQKKVEVIKEQTPEVRQSPPANTETPRTEVTPSPKSDISKKSMNTPEASKAPVALSKDFTASGATATFESDAVAPDKSEQEYKSVPGVSSAVTIADKSDSKDPVDISGMLAFAESALNMKPEAQVAMSAPVVESQANSKAMKSGRASKGKAAKPESSMPMERANAPLSLPDAVNFYQLKEFEKADRLIQTILNSGPADNYARTYAVLSKIHLDKLGDARQEAAIIKNTDLFAGRYLEAIILLKENKRSEAIAVLEELASSENRYKEKSLQVLMRLK